ncbi:MAG: NEW3 domain-containing protein [archaeon]
MKKSIIVLCALILLMGVVSAANIEISSVEINGRDRTPADGHSNNFVVDRGEDIDIVVEVFALTDVDDVQVEADIYGYRYSTYEEDKVSDTSRTFDLKENDSDTVSLSLQAPLKIDTDYFKLRIRAADRDGQEISQVYELRVAGVATEDAVQIKDFHFSPESVIAGRAITGSVKVKNYGDKTLKDITVKVSMPDLGVSDTENLDELEADESRTFEELLLRIPACTKPGTYDVVMTVEFDEYEKTTQTSEITVTSGDCTLNQPSTPDEEELTTITIPQKLEVRKGTTGTAYPVIIKNNANKAVSYVLSVSGVSWGTYRLEPSSLIVINAGETKTAYLYVTADDKATEGDQIFTIGIDANGETKQVVLTATVTPGQKSANDNLRKGLEIALIVLVIILILVGLIYGFMKLREGGNKEEAQTYY